MEEYIRAKRLIKKAFVINYSIPKGYGVRSSDYANFYDKKMKLIAKAIDLIKIYNLSIKYGQKNEIIYFEFEGKQFSFHGFPCIGIKAFKGEWIGHPNDIREGIHYRGKNKPTLVGRKDSCYKSDLIYTIN